MLDAVQAGTGRKHPAGKDPLGGLGAVDLAVIDLAIVDFVDLDEALGQRRLGLRPRQADARRDLQRAELDRLVDGDVEGNDAPGDLVEPGEDRGGMADGVRARAGAGQHRRAKSPEKRRRDEGPGKAHQASGDQA